MVKIDLYYKDIIKLIKTNRKKGQLHCFFYLIIFIVIIFQAVYQITFKKTESLLFSIFVATIICYYFCQGFIYLIGIFFYHTKIPGNKKLFSFLSLRLEEERKILEPFLKDNNLCTPAILNGFIDQLTSKKSNLIVQVILSSIPGLAFSIISNFLNFYQINGLEYLQIMIILLSLVILLCAFLLYAIPKFLELFNMLPRYRLKKIFITIHRNS